jgi:hypothetical protein
MSRSRANEILEGGLVNRVALIQVNGARSLGIKAAVE